MALGLGILFFSVVKYNLLKNGYYRSICLELCILLDQN